MVLKPFCLCVVAPMPWTVGFAHWEPQLFLFSAVSIPAVADAVDTPVWANFPSSRGPSRDTGNWAINTEEQFAAASGPLFCHILWSCQWCKAWYSCTVRALHLPVSSWSLRLTSFGLFPMVHCSVKHWLRKLGKAVNKCSISLDFCHLQVLYTHSSLHDRELNLRPREGSLKSVPVLGNEGVRCEHDRWDQYGWKGCSLHGFALNTFSFEVEKLRKNLFHAVLPISSQINE